jgi:hypothetical protein
VRGRVVLLGLLPMPLGILRLTRAFSRRPWWDFGLSRKGAGGADRRRVLATERSGVRSYPIAMEGEACKKNRLMDMQGPDIRPSHFPKIGTVHFGGTRDRATGACLLR